MNFRLVHVHAHASYIFAPCLKGVKILTHSLKIFYACKIKSSVLPILEKMTLYKFEISRYVFFIITTICRDFSPPKSLLIFYGDKRSKRVLRLKIGQFFKQIILISSSQKNNISLTLISFTGTYEPTIDLLPTSVAS